MLRRLAVVLLVATAACGSGGGGSDNPALTGTGPASTAPKLQLMSSAFTDGGDIPSQYTCDGAGQSPPLSWSGVPSGTASLALRVQDIDTPTQFIHWLIYDVPPSTTSLASGEVPSGAKQATNSFNKVGYGGPCPPAGSKHRYVFTMLALGTQLTTSESVSANDLWSTLERSQVIAKGELTGTYQRKS